MPQPSHSGELQAPLLRINFVLVRGIILSCLTLAVVAGLAVVVRHLLKPETIAKVRLERAGYKAEAPATFQAIEREDSLALVRLKTAGISLLSRNDLGRTPYEMAIRTDHLPMLEALASLDAVPKLEASVFESCLTEALQRNSLATAAYLLQQGTNPNLEVEPGLPALAWSIATKRDAALNLLIEHKANIKSESKLGTPLWLAYSQGNDALFDRLLSLGADPHQLDLSGRLLGARAVLEGREAYVRRLLAAGLSPNAVGKDGVSMLEAAFQKRAEPVFLELIRAGGDLATLDAKQQTFLERATAERDYRWMEVLLKRGVDPNLRTAGNRQPLWWSSYEQGDPVAAELLLKAGADISAQAGDAGQTPLELAIERDQFRVTRYLFGHGAATSNQLWGLLQGKNYDMMRLVMANGDDPNARNPGGMTPLAYAVRVGDVTAASLLVEYGARFDKSDRPDGQSLLEWALAHRHLELIELMVSQGANVNEPLVKPLHPDFLASFKANGNLLYHLKGDSNVTPLMVLAGSHQLDAARFLVEHGAKRSVWTRRNRTDPVTFAIRSENLPMAQLMLGREPELDGKYQRKVVVSRSEQRARFYRDGELVYSTRCSTGKSGYRTPGGTFVITDKSRLRYSTLYGAAMPFFHRLSGSAVGMHEGYVPGYPASHGCIRLPYEYAKLFFEHTRLGDIVVVE